MRYAKNKFFAPRAIATLALLALAPMSAKAGNLYVPNASFESQPTQFADPRIDSWQIPAQPSSFNTNVFGSWANLAGVFANTSPTNSDHIVNATGNQLAYLFSYPQMALFQDYNSTDWSGAPPSHAFNATYQPGMSYTLTVGLTGSSDEPLSPGATLLAELYYVDSSSNMVAVATTNITYDTNVFSHLTNLIDFQVTVTNVHTNDPWAGKHIGILFESTVAPQLIGGVWDLDNVRLTTSIFVPNASFESQPTQFADPRIDSWQIPAQPSSFNTNVFGSWANLAGVFANTAPTNSDHIVNAAGNQLAYLFSYPQMALFQDYNSTDWSTTVPTHAFNPVYLPGMSYTLTAGVTGSSDEPLNQGATLLMELYYTDNSSNMVAVAATNITYDTNVFSHLTNLIDFSLTLPNVKPTDPWAGKHIGILFESTVAPQLIGGVWDLDNVRLVPSVATTFAAGSLTTGQFSFTLSSEPGHVFSILAATNVAQRVASWTNIATVTNVTGTFNFTDPAAASPQRFYQARQLQ
jgi:hypothetical protein